MADKSKMACNKPTKSDRAGKKKMVKGCEGGKKSLFTLEHLSMVITIQLLLVNLLKQDTNAELLKVN